jgi:hypothetical protein
VQIDKRLLLTHVTGSDAPVRCVDVSQAFPGAHTRSSKGWCCCLLRTAWEDQVWQAQQRVRGATTDDSGTLKEVEQEMDEEHDEVLPATSVGNVAIMVVS